MFPLVFLGLAQCANYIVATLDKQAWDSTILCADISVANIIDIYGVEDISKFLANIACNATAREEQLVGLG